MVNNPGNEDFYEEEKFTVHHSLILSVLLLSGAAWFSYQKSRMDSTGHIPDPATEYLITQYADATGVQGTFIRSQTMTP